MDKQDLVAGPHVMKGLYAMKKDNDVLTQPGNDTSQVGGCYDNVILTHALLQATQATIGAAFRGPQAAEHTVPKATKAPRKAPPSKSGGAGVKADGRRRPKAEQTCVCGHTG